MKAPNRIYVEVCEDGIFAFPEPPFKESVEYIRADLVGQSLQQEWQEVDLEKEVESYLDGFIKTPTRTYFRDTIRHFYELGKNARKEEGL